MNRPKLFKTLRIAWSVGWELLAVLLCVLWVRSYWWDDVVTAPGDGSCRYGSAEGWLTVRWMEPRRMPKINLKVWQVVSESVEERHHKLARIQVKSRRPQFGFVDAGAAQFPYWFTIVLASLFSIAPWLPRRFSLRTLLIATTLVAVVLGLAVYASR